MCCWPGLPMLNRIRTAPSRVWNLKILLGVKRKVEAYGGVQARTVLLFLLRLE